MTNTKRAIGARALALLLAIVMLGGIFAVSAQAADATNVKQYNHYVCLGDSIAAGYGSYGRDVRGLVTVPEAYHSLVANATGAELQSLANTGMRTVEALWLLDDSYSASTEAANLNAMYFNGMHDYLYWMAGRTSTTDPGDPKYADPDSVYYIRPGTRQALMGYYGEYGLKHFYRNNIKDSDLITVALGLNDIFLYAMKMTAAQLDNPGMNLITEVASFLNYMRIGYSNFQKNWAPLINAIKSYNPNITIVVVGMYNPFSKVNLSSNAQWANVGTVAEGMVQAANSYMRQQASALGYAYADVTGTEIDDTVPFTDPTFFDRIVMDCHPTVAGHQYIANQILAQLPVRGSEPTPPAPSRLPFQDVATSDWFYDEVAYCWDNGLMNGVSDDLFDPNGSTTRAQFAMVLYRLAKTPSVSGLSTPFTDLEPGAWYEDAVVWGYHQGIINGTSTSTFTPNASITREQMVSMLYRYSGAETPTGSLNTMFSDAWRISDYAKPAVLWAVQNGIVSGMGNGTFYPQGYATRGLLAKVLHMYQTM